MDLSKTFNGNVMFTLFGRGYWSENAQKYVPSTHECRYSMGR